MVSLYQREMGNFKWKWFTCIYCDSGQIEFINVKELPKEWNCGDCGGLLIKKAYQELFNKELEIIEN